MENTHRGVGRRVAGAAGGLRLAEDVGSHVRDHVHVGGRCVHVGRAAVQPPSESMNRPYSCSNRLLDSPSGIAGEGSAITALPPPCGKPTLANFRLMASESRMSSASASATRS